MSKVSLRWVESQLMTGADSFGHPIVIGNWPEQQPNWGGLKPSDLLLLSVASCTAYDVVLILTKQRAPLEGLSVVCEGTQETDPPYRFTHIHIRYVVEGDVSPESLERAIRLSEEKYCSVINTLKDVVEITSEFEVRVATP